MALHVTPATADDRAEVGRLTAAVQEATGESVEVASTNQGYTGERPAEAARANGIELEGVKLPEAERGFVLLPRRWVVERSFSWSTRLLRLARDDERLPETLAGRHLVAFATCMLTKAVAAFDLVRNTLWMGHRGQTDAGPSKRDDHDAARHARAHLCADAGRTVCLARQGR